MNKKMSNYRIVTIVFGALALLAFFFLPCYHNSLISGLGLFGDMLGTSVDDGGMANITAFQLVAAGFQEEIVPVETSFLFLGSAVFPLAVIIDAAIGKKKAIISCISCSAALLVVFICQMFTVGDLGLLGYRISFLYYLVFVFGVITLVMGILELRSLSKKERSGAENRKFADRFDQDATVYEGAGQKFWSGAASQGAIQCVEGEYEGAVLPIGDGERVLIGRSAADCNLILSDPSVSRVHCYVTYFPDRGVYGVTDVSKHGVYDSHGKMIEKNQMVYMASGDEIRIGQTRNIFQLR